MNWVRKFIKSYLDECLVKMVWPFRTCIMWIVLEAVQQTSLNLKRTEVKGVSVDVRVWYSDE